MATDSGVPSSASTRFPAPLLGPAVSPANRESAPEPAGELVPPFIALRPVSPSDPAQGVEGGDAGPLPMTEVEERPDPAPAAGETAELPEWMSWVTEIEDTHTSVAESTVGSEYGAVPDGPAVPEEVLSSEAPPATAVPALESAVGGALGEVADRLERIAASLRRRSAAELLAGPGGLDASDPLEVLITGFVLGYSQRDASRGD